MTHPSPEDVLNGQGPAPTAASFGELPGSTVAGRVVATPRTFQSREYDATGTLGKPKFFPSGDPIYGISIDLATTLRENADDDGVRRLYADKQRLLTAIREAVRAVGKIGVEAGGYLSVTWTGTESGKGTIPANTYTATYSPPGAQVPVPNGAAQYAAPQQPQYAPQQPQPQYAAPQQPQYASSLPQYLPPPPPPQAKVVTETVAAALANAGVDLTGYTVIPG